VTTRIINFLKGLPIRDSMSLPEVLSRHWADSRIRIGIELLSRLEASRRLYFSTSRGLVENRHFLTELLMRVFTEAKSIYCQNGRSIDVAKFFCRPVRPRTAVHVADRLGWRSL
jgi:hypothetical protein